MNEEKLVRCIDTSPNKVGEAVPVEKDKEYKVVNEDDNYYKLTDPKTGEVFRLLKHRFEDVKVKKRKVLVTPFLDGKTDYINLSANKAYEAEEDGSFYNIVNDRGTLGTYKHDKFVILDNANFSTVTATAGHGSAITKGKKYTALKYDGCNYLITTDLGYSQWFSAERFFNNKGNNKENNKMANNNSKNNAGSMILDAIQHGGKVAAANKISDKFLDIGRAFMGESAAATVLATEEGRAITKMAMSGIGLFLLQMKNDDGTRKVPVPPQYADAFEKICQFVIEGTSNEFLAPRIGAVMEMAEDLLTTAAKAGIAAVKDVADSNETKAVEEEEVEVPVMVELPVAIGARTK